MTTQKHLDAIKRHIKGLLAIAEKRTPGGWLINQTQPTTICDSNRDITIASTRGLWPVYERAKPDATFIASAAGNFEAALRSTLVAIDCCLNYNHECLEAQAKSILAEWPIERLTGGQGV